jgi:hypothetical protein
MSKKINFKLDFKRSLEGYIKEKYPKVIDYRVISKSLDARGAPIGKSPSYNYTVEVLEAGEVYQSEHFEFPDLSDKNIKPIIIGAGPAGLFAAVRLSEYGVKATIIEQN